jgi:hypothetical protein
MQDFIDQATKNGITLIDSGKCQLCGADTIGGIYECVSLYSTGFNLLDFSKIESHISRFLSVDAHALQHSEIHGRWNNHFHLTRLHLILKLDYKWDYNKSPLLSNYLNGYKKDKNNEILIPPKPMERGSITTIDILNNAKTESECKDLIKQWALTVYNSWANYHNLVDIIAKGFIDKQ